MDAFGPPRPTFPYESQWEEFKGWQRVRFRMLAIMGLLTIGMFGLLLWESFADGVGRDFLVGMVMGTLVCITAGVVLPCAMRLVMKRRKRMS
jgi:hypothetical protein